MRVSEGDTIKLKSTQEAPPTQRMSKKLNPVKAAWQMDKKTSFLLIITPSPTHR
jgi:hypothetical protein